ncbi:hypothetical protein ANCCAN_02853 [Ancylostoma caninum]|uniref:Rad21/Rec8-like protein C-terminal eukaryotic domain-containing protein n=1 Tax=Ancylostoma caninum TaxID=29170 RepID=A0A368H3A9_ANCCA|nr:hypothetical protein ANCCAN_02853 [Ancylostoma caninum]
MTKISFNRLTKDSAQETAAQIFTSPLEFEGSWAISVAQHEPYGDLLISACQMSVKLSSDRLVIKPSMQLLAESL